MPIPDYQTLMLPILKLGSTGNIQLKEAVNNLAQKFNLSEEEKSELLPSGNTSTIKNRVAWAVVYLVKAGLLVRPYRGFFTISDEGKEVLTQNPNRIDRRFLMQFPAFVEFQQKKSKKNENITIQSPNDDSIVTPEERIGIAYEEITDEIKSELLSKVLESSPEFFEKLIVKLLVAMGYGGSVLEAGKHLGKSGDGGIDGIINQDALGLDAIYIQAKRYAVGNPLGRPDVQKFAGSLMGFTATKGVFVTTSSFSSHAYEYARNVDKRIILIDGEKLTSLMLEHNVGVRVSQIIELRKLDEDFFIEE